jgi:hypothetical protein
MNLSFALILGKVSLKLIYLLAPCSVVAPSSLIKLGSKFTSSVEYDFGQVLIVILISLVCRLIGLLEKITSSNAALF